MCTRVFNFDQGNYAITGKNTDWFYPMDARVYINPVGLKKQGMSEPLARFYNIPTEDILSWQSAYQSIIYYAYGKLPELEDQGYQDTEFCAMDGMNSKGLAVSVLADSKSTFNDVQEPGSDKIATIRFSQYLLDCFSSVAEAIIAIEKNPPFLFDPGVPNKSARPAWFHFALSDPSGNSAIIEFKEGELEIYQSPEYVVMTNQPSYDVQLNLLKYWQYQWSPEDGEILATVPGGTSSVQRFERASYYQHFTQPLTEPKLAVSQTKGIMSTVATPMQFSKDGQEHDRYVYTIWTTLCDQMNQRFYFQPSQTMNSMYLDMPEPEISKSAHFVQIAEERDNDYLLNDSSGDISAQLTKAEQAPFTI